MSKLEKLEREAQRIKERIEELQESLKQIDKQKVELENAQIIQLVRSLKLSPDKLHEFLVKGAIPSVIGGKPKEPKESGNISDEN